MRAFIPVVMLLFLSGIGVASAASADVDERSIKEWRDAVDERYDLPALHRFLLEVVREQKKFEDVDLTTAKVTDSWGPGGCALFSGDWTFSCPRPEADTFAFDFFYSDKLFVSLECVRISRDAFRFTKASKGELVELMVSSEKRQPNKPVQINAVDAPRNPGTVIAIACSSRRV